MEFKLRNAGDPGLRVLSMVLLLLCSGLAVSISGQVEGLLDTKTIEHSLKRQYRLTAKELEILKPILRQQNEELVIALDRCVDQDQIDYLSLWIKILIKREEFETASAKGMTARQAQVMRAARLKFELRILNEWRGLYVEELASFLDLDWFQFSLLEKIFLKDQKERLKVSSLASQPHFWQSLSEDLEKQIERILSPVQVTDYRRLKARGDRLLS